MGLILADRQISTTRSAVLALALLPLCGLFAACVEFSQLFVPVRTCAGSDVVAQTVGSALGMVGWLIGGQWLTEQVRQATTGGGAAGRFLVAYVLLLGFIQALPLDLTLSPAQAYRKFRDGKVRVIPFGEFRTFNVTQTWERSAGLLKLAGLYLPAGLLAGCLPRNFGSSLGVSPILVLAIALPVGIEAGQVLVESRVSSATDALVGAIAIMVGWQLAWSFSASKTSCFIVALVWLASLIIISWQPFTLAGVRQPFDWMPGMPLEGGNPLAALEEMLTKLVLFALLGVIVSIARRDKNRNKNIESQALAATFGLMTSIMFEFGQTRMANHTPCITDVLLGGLGAGVGAWVAGRVSHVARGTST
jgi:VanZ family protein